MLTSLWQFIMLRASNLLTVKTNRRLTLAARIFSCKKKEKNMENVKNFKIAIHHKKPTYQHIYKFQNQSAGCCKLLASLCSCTMACSAKFQSLRGQFQFLFMFIVHVARKKDKQQQQHSKKNKWEWKSLSEGHAKK